MDVAGRTMVQMSFFDKCRSILVVNQSSLLSSEGGRICLNSVLNYAYSLYVTYICYNGNLSSTHKVPISSP